MSARPIIGWFRGACQTLVPPPSLSVGKKPPYVLGQPAPFLVTLLILITPICLAESSTENNPHHFQQYCGTCHEMSARPDNPEYTVVGPLYLDINRACTQAGCHDYDSGLNHPVGIKATGQVPAQMPLDSQGQITCLTCHDELGGADYLPAYLRHAPGKDFCGSCHRGTGEDVKKHSHQQATTRAHLNIWGRRTSSENHTEANPAIDLESYTCLSCHDNISVVVPRDNESASEKRRRRQDMSDHPIGMNYARKALADSNRFKAPLAIDNRIRFFDGRVGCGSCHSPYSGNEKHLALSSTKGSLCRQCHIR